LRLVAASGSVAVIGVAIAAALFLREHPRSTATTQPPPAAVSLQPDFPTPPRGAVVFSRQLGSDALALGVVPRRGSVLLQASVLGPKGGGAQGLTVAFRLRGESVRAVPCGPGCYRAELATSRRPEAFEVAVQRGSRTTRWRVVLPERWPPPDAHALVARASRVWRSLRSLSFDERLASDSRAPEQSRWSVEAPDRVAYQVKHGWAGIIIGGRRWDRPPGGSRWIASRQTPVTQPVPSWVSAVDAHVLGVRTIHGRATWLISFFDPGTPGWFEIALDQKTLHALEVHMITTRHFMSDVYSAFNATKAIRSPDTP
jgi:hypothetical protein